MKTIALFFLLLGSALFAEPSVLTDEPAAQPQEAAPAIVPPKDPTVIDNLFSGVSLALNMEFSQLPDRFYVGEVIPVTVKLTPVDTASGDIEYTLQNEEGLRIFSDTPRREVKEDGVYDTFYFVVESSSLRLPDITATLTSLGRSSDPLIGTTLSASMLNPPATYANVMADRFEIVNYKTTVYDNDTNIVVFTVKASRCDIGSFRLPNAVKQGFESKSPGAVESQMTYYAIIPDSEESINFSYFNLDKQRYESLVIPIIVDDDTVSTQSDLSPTDARHTELKMAAAIVFAVLLGTLYYWKRKKWYLYASVLPVFYLLYVLLPKEEVCVKKGASIYLLPINHGTVFEKTEEKKQLEAEKEVGDFIKVHLNDDQIGWVNKRDLCSN